MRRVINSFTSGVFSPLMAGRLDMAEAMATGCRVLQNFQVHPTGGIFRRSGLRWLGPVKHADKAAVLMPFQRDAETVFQLEAGEDYLRVWNPDGTLSAVDLVAPWKDAEVAGITFLQSNDVMLLFWDGPPQVLSRTATGWELKELEWKYPPLREPNIGPVTLTCSVANTGETGTLTADANVFEAGHVGSYWEISNVREEPYVSMEMGRGSADASAVLTLTAVAVAGTQVSIGSGADLRRYTWRANDSVHAANDVGIGSAAVDSVDNLKAAINGPGGGGPGTVPHPLVTAENDGTFTTAAHATGRLTFAGNYLISATPANGFKIGTRDYIFKAAPLTAAYQIKLGATLEESIANTIAAINDADGVADGGRYGPGTLANVDVTASPTAGADAVTVTAIVAGAPGEAIATGFTPPYTHGNSGLLSWSDEHLTQGEPAGSAKLKITARASGEDGDGIPVDETMGVGSWNSTVTVGGETVSAMSGELRVTGKWEVFSVGEWTGTVWLEKKDGDSWETLRTWKADGDYNIQTNGQLETEEILRLRFYGTGKVTSSATFNAPNPRAQLTALSPEVKGVVKVTEFLTPASVKVKVIKPLYVKDPATDPVPAPTKRWAEGAFSEVRGWPRAACFFEQRLALAGVRDEPERLHFSATADLYNFERTGLEDAGFGFDLAATESSPVVTLASMGDGLFIGTETGEWIAKGGEGGRPMSGSSRTALPKNAVGGAGRRPLVFGSKVIFVESSERALREFVFDWQDQNYAVPDLTEASAHLMRSGIRCIAFARKPAPVIYAVTNDGRLLSCLYRRESKIVAWAEHTTAGAFEWVSVNAGKSADTDDQVWFIVNRGGQRTVEKFDDRHFDNLQLAEPADMLHCDGAVTVEGPVSEVSGLGHMNEKEVVILADGKVHTRSMVSDGKVLLDAVYNKVTVGLPYVSEVQPMPFEMALDDGVASGRRQKAGPLSVHFFRSLAVKYADSAETPHAQRYDLNFRDGADEGAAAPPVFTGWKPMAPAAKFRDSVDVVLSTDEPLPLNILAIAPTSQVYGA